MDNKKIHKPGFTLTEIMIVVTIIGVLSAILLPGIFTSTPDKNIIKFKKAHGNFVSMINTFITSGEYFLEGDLGKRPDGSPNGDKDYFCNQMANVLSAPNTNCNDIGGDPIRARSCTENSGNCISHDPILTKNEIDYHCLKETGNFEGLSVNTTPNFIETSDKTVYMEYSKTYLFSTSGIDPYLRTATPPSQILDEFNRDATYFIFCIDIDGSDGPIKPFGYGVRRDGKIITGSRADWWLERDIKRNETSICPTTLESADVNARTYNLCD